MKIIANAAVMMLAAAFVSAGELSVTAELSANRAALGDQIVLSVSVSGSGSVAIKPPLIPDVEVYESGKSQSMSIINGRVSSNAVHTFVLNPRKSGRFIVPPIEIPGAAPTAPIAFDIDSSANNPVASQPPRAPSSPPAAPDATARQAVSPDAFVTAALDKNRALVNEQVTLIVRFYTAVPLLGAPQYNAPTLTGLLSENLGEGQGSTVIGGRTYNFSELKSALFPVQPGRSEIGPAFVTVQLPRRASGRGTGDDFFDRFFNMAAPEARRLQTDPLTLHADPLPPGAPEDFSGIIGTLSVEASADRVQLKAGEALNLTVRVSGIGNIKSLPEPKRPELPSVRFFDSESAVKFDRVGDKVGGAKTFKSVVVPRVSGTIDIPAMTVSYFDSVKRAYSRAQSKPIRLTVLPGDANAPATASGSAAAPAPGVTEVSADIRYLKAPNGRSTFGDFLATFGGSGPWHGLPGAFFAAAVLIDWRRRARMANPRARRSSQARGESERRLKQAEAQSEAERARAVDLLGEALVGYFADKLDEPHAGISLKTVLQRLENLKTPPGQALLSRLKSAWEELDLLRYAPGGAGQAEVKRIADEIRSLSFEFEKEFRI